MFLAPLNTMAANISGTTLHSFGEIQFKDRHGITIRSKKQGQDNVSTMHVKCASLRFLLIDEIEATGAEVLADLESAVQAHGNKIFRRDENMLLPKPWGGVNVFMFGDFWQLPPVGQIPIMSNPFQEKVLESARLNYIMSMFWDKDCMYSVQRWEHDNCRVLDLTVSKRIKHSGDYVWFSELLTSCREGNMTQNQYNFLHGIPTEVSGCWSDSSVR